jgi:hypothetical protein
VWDARFVRSDAPLVRGGASLGQMEGQGSGHGHGHGHGDGPRHPAAVSVAVAVPDPPVLTCPPSFPAGGSRSLVP